MPPTLLIIASDVPYPPDAGNRLDLWALLTFFRSQGCRLEVIVSKQSPPDHVNWPHNDIPCHFVPRQPRWQGEELTQTVMAVQARVDALHPAAILFHYADFAPLAAALRIDHSVIWFRMVNFELAHIVEKAFQQLPKDSNPLRRWRRRLGWVWQHRKHLRQVYHAEAQAHRLANVIFYIGHADQQAMTRLYPKPDHHAWVLPPLKRTSVPQASLPLFPINLIYVGSNFVNNVNQAGGDFLVNDILPVLRHYYPGEFRVHLVGQGSQERYSLQASDDLVLHGYVDDLEALMHTMHVVCVPVALGWGCKLKMLEGLAYGLPVVGARQSFRGVAPAHEAYYACQTLDDYLRALGELRDPQRRREVGRHGQQQLARWFNDGQKHLQWALKTLDSPAQR